MCLHCAGVFGPLLLHTSNDCNIDGVADAGHLIGGGKWGGSPVCVRTYVNSTNPKKMP